MREDNMLVWTDAKFASFPMMCVDEHGDPRLPKTSPPNPDPLQHLFPSLSSRSPARNHSPAKP